MILVMGALVWFAVRLVLRPLMRLKTEVETRALSDLSDVDPALVHKEMRPLVSAMNGSMSRLQQLIASQRRFIADASHQLRTPLTVLKTQAELAMRACDRQAGNAAGSGRPARHRALSIAATTDSTVLLANRLLTLARIEHGGDSLAMDTVVAARRGAAGGAGNGHGGRRQAISTCRWKRPTTRPCRARPAAARTAGQPGRQCAALHAARRQRGPARAPPRARHGHGAVLEVEDSGAGIPPAERERVFTPFYRVGAALEAILAAPAWAWPSCATSPPCMARAWNWPRRRMAMDLKVGVHFSAPAPVDAKIAP